jgi:hypothetical protein
MLMTTTPAIADFSPQVDNPAEHYREVVTGEAGKSPELDVKSPELNELTTEPPKPEAQPVELSEEEKAERLWWDKVLVLGKIRDCARMKEDTEGEIDDLMVQLKLKKEILKGQQALMGLYSTQLADILDGHPLPKNPQATTETTQDAGEVGGETKAAEADDWRDLSTEKLLEGTKGLGAKKLEAIIELAPTAGQLEDLRGQASMAYKSFKEVLPKGCGESMADEIEKKLEDHIRDWTRNQPDETEASDSE